MRYVSNFANVLCFSTDISSWDSPCAVNSCWATKSSYAKNPISISSLLVRTNTSKSHLIQFISFVFDIDSPCLSDSSSGYTDHISCCASTTVFVCSTITAWTTWKRSQCASGSVRRERWLCTDRVRTRTRTRLSALWQCPGWDVWTVDRCATSTLVAINRMVSGYVYNRFIFFPFFMSGLFDIA